MHVLDCNRTHLHAWPEQVLTDTQADSYAALIERRRAGEPVAYLTGRREFWSLDLEVTPDTLIPRPETELLVELALERIPLDADWHIADLGTGSGAIALAIAKERPRCHVLGIDQSAGALAVAQSNAKRHQLDNVRFLRGDWLTGIEQSFDMIVSNPPYVEAQDPHLREGDVRFEPPRALASGPDGLDDIRHIIGAAALHLTPGGWLLLEHGFDQGGRVAALLRQAGFQGVVTAQDLGGRDRVSLGHRPTD